MLSYYYEDFNVGDQWSCGAWTIGEASLVEFATK